MIVCLELLLWRLCVIACLERAKKYVKHLVQLGLVGLLVVVVCQPWNDGIFVNFLLGDRW